MSHTGSTLIDAVALHSGMLLVVLCIALCKPWFLRSMVAPLTAVRRMHLHCGVVKAQSSQSEGWSKATWLVALGGCVETRLGPPMLSSETMETPLSHAGTPLMHPQHHSTARSTEASGTLDSPCGVLCSFRSHYLFAISSRSVCHLWSDPGPTFKLQSQAARLLETMGATIEPYR